MNTDLEKSNNKKELDYLSWLHVFNDGFQESLVLLLPFITADLGITLSQVGFLGTVLKVLGVFLSIPAGYIASRFGALKTLIFAVLIYAIGYLGTGISHELWQLSIFFFLAGLSFGIFHPVAFALAARLTDKKNRGKAMGNFTAIGDVGRIGLSTLVTLLAGLAGWRIASVSYGFAGMAVFIAFVILIKKLGTNIQSKEGNDQVEETKREEKEMKVSYTRFVKEPRFLLASSAGFLDTFASGSLFILIPFLLVDKGIDKTILGGFTSAFFIGNFLGKALLGRITDRFGYTKVLITAELVMAVLIYLLTVTNERALIVVISILLGAVTKGTVPVVQVLVSNSIDHIRNYEKGFGIYSLVVNIASTLSPLLLGLIADQLGINTAFYVMAILIILVVPPTIILKRLTPS